jgi:hypothetical protein
VWSALRSPRGLWHNQRSVMQHDSHRSTSSTLAGLAGRASYAGGSWRFYAWRFI